MIATALLLVLAAQAAPAATPARRPAPPCSTAEYRALDFWVGEWDLTFTGPNGGTRTATNRITRDEFGPCVISEHFEQPDIGYVGASHSTYDGRRQRWVQTWVDNGGGYITLVGGPVTGQPYSFEFSTVDSAGPGQRPHRMIWQDVQADSLIWRWQERLDDGTYADRWVLNYRRRR